jgi:uncharacterized protein (TIGR01777 family)
MLTPFRLGVGGRIGDGRQYMSWISIDDAVRAVRFLIDAPGIRGPVNLVSPAPVTNREFTHALARALRRPAVLPLPAFAARILFGEMADATLLAGSRIVPEVLRNAGFEFEHATLDAALGDIMHGRRNR